MKISELALAGGVSVATVKFYLREGVLQRGVAVSATRAEYGQEHLDRLRLIHALSVVRDLPIARVRAILELIDAPLEDPLETIGRAVGALPPYIDDDGDHAQALATIEALGLNSAPDFAAVAQLESAIRGLKAAGLAWGHTEIRRYGEAMRSVAREEIAPMTAMPRAEALVYAVLGTALYEPVILALRRLAHHDALVRRTST